MNGHKHLAAVTLMSVLGFLQLKCDEGKRKADRVERCSAPSRSGVCRKASLFTGVACSLPYRKLDHSLPTAELASWLPSSPVCLDGDGEQFPVAAYDDVGSNRLELDEKVRS